MSIQTLSSPSRQFTPVQAEWFRVFHPDPSAALRLFCFPPVGGSPSFYARWVRSWPGVEVHAVQAPGREKRIRERPLTRMQELVDGIVANLPDDKPFAFFGHSLGAMVAYEVTCRLREQGRELPIRLFLSACPAPSVARTRRNRYLLPEPELLDYLRTLGGTPQEVLRDQEIMAIALPIVRADFEVADTYTYALRAPLGVPVTIFGGTRDEEVRENELVAWRFHAGGHFRMKMFEANHFYLNAFEQELADEIRHDLASHHLTATL